jgi:hypothetical protein
VFLCENFRSYVSIFFNNVRAAGAGVIALCAVLVGCEPSRPEFTPKPADIAAPAIVFKFAGADADDLGSADGDSGALVPVPAGTLDRRLVPECSALLRSPKHAGVFWTLSDSDKSTAGNVLVPVRADGTAIRPPAALPATTPAAWRGVVVTGAGNRDWEALCDDGVGNLIIGDIGNNSNRSRRLALYVVPEPSPADATTAPARRIAVRHAAQTKFPDPRRRFDCESIFVWNGAVYTFTKRRADTWTELCRLRLVDGATLTTATAGVFEAVAAFDSGGLVTDAALSPDGRRLAVLTYHSLWVFDLPASAGGASHPLAGARAWRRRVKFPAETWQAEGVAFLDEGRVLVGTEQGALFTVEIPSAKAH